MFDLNKAIAEWRSAFKESDSISVIELDELESHLRDTHGVLQVQLDSPEEAFWLATRRLGASDELSREFSKIKPAQTWMRRAQWMLVGYLVVSLLVSLSSVLEISASRLAIYFGLPLWQAASFTSLGTTLCMLMLIVWTWRAACGRSSGLQGVSNRFGQMARSGNQVLLVVTVLLLFAIPAIMQLGIQMGSTHYLSRQEYGLSSALQFMMRVSGRTMFLATMATSVCWLANQESTNEKRSNTKLAIVLLLFVFVVAIFFPVLSVFAAPLIGIPYPG